MKLADLVLVSKTRADLKSALAYGKLLAGLKRAA